MGSACFAVASLPFAASLAHQGIVGITYFTGSVCFLVSSALGSVAFGSSAIASYVVPNTDQAVNASLATSGTLIGAILFFRAAQLIRATERPRTG